MIWNSLESLSISKLQVIVEVQILKLCPYKGHILIGISYVHLDYATADKKLG